MGRGREQLHVLNTKIYSDMTNADLPVFFLFRHVKQGAFNHTEFKKNFQNSEPSDTKSKATERPPKRKNKLVNSLRAKYKFVHLMKLICKFIVNTQNAIRSCLLALIFDPTTLIEIAVYCFSFKKNKLIQIKCTCWLKPSVTVSSNSELSLFDPSKQSLL